MYLMSLLFPGRLASKQKGKKDIRDYQKDLNEKYVHMYIRTKILPFLNGFWEFAIWPRLPFRARYSNGFIQNISGLKLENM